MDDAHLADSMTADFLSGLILDIETGSENGGADGSPPGLVITYRTEPPFRAALRPIAQALHASSASAPGAILELGRLPQQAVQEWLELAGESGEETAAMAAGLDGHPLAIHEAIRRGGAARGEAPQGAKGFASILEGYLSALRPEAKALLQLIAILGRPAPLDLAAAAIGVAEPKLRTFVEALLEEGALTEDRGLFFFQHGSLKSWLEEGMPATEREAIHRGIATILEKRDEASVEEMAYHWLRSGRPERGAKAALEAARLLARSHEDRKAVGYYRVALESIPKEDWLARQAIGLETAEACSRTGDHARGMEIIKGLIEEREARPAIGSLDTSSEAGPLHGRLGVIAHKAGDIAEASFHLEKGLELLAGAEGLDKLRERLRILSELAEISSNRGDYARSEACCRQASTSCAGRRIPRAIARRGAKRW